MANSIKITSILFIILFMSGCKITPCENIYPSTSINSTTTEKETTTKCTTTEKETVTEHTTIEKAFNKVTVTATGYCPCYKCSEGYGNNTASGKKAQANHTIAADTSIFPMGTKIRFNDIIYTVEDVGGGVKGYHIDIFFSTHEEALDWGKRTVEVEVLK